MREEVNAGDLVLTVPMRTWHEGSQGTLAADPLFAWGLRVGFAPVKWSLEGEKQRRRCL